MRTICVLMFTLFPGFVPAQEYGPPDRGEPGDARIQEYLAETTEAIHKGFLADVNNVEKWEQLRPAYKKQYFHMLGLWPLPEKTPLHPTTTGTYEGDGYAVDMIHYQSRPKLYVTGNLYRPARIEKGKKLPAVFYVCGHSHRGRNGNKTAYQSHGIWFARHGYLCLTVDSLQLGEIGATHHGTYRYNRWWWHSRGYTPAGVECWNGIRGIDYLTSRPDVDPGRIAVTGISGGGAATFWIACADERVRVAVPVSGMADLPSYVTNRVINGHCDCMFLYNTYQWPWTRIAGLIAPRPLLFVNSDADRIFPMDANERIINRLERLYSYFGAGDRVDSLVSVGGHAYRKDIRRGAYRFINSYLCNDPREIADSETDLVMRKEGKYTYPIPMEKLRVFPTDADLPVDERNTEIDRHFVPMAEVKPPEPGKFAAWKEELIKSLKEYSFRPLPEPALKPIYTLKHIGGPAENPKRVLLVVVTQDSIDKVPEWIKPEVADGDAVYLCQPRGFGETKWTRKNPPNYVERCHVLLGFTVDRGRVIDCTHAAGELKKKTAAPLWIAGRGAGGILAAYTALWDEAIAGTIAIDPPGSHMEQDAPQFLNVLRVCDIPEILGMLAPRPLHLTAPASLKSKVNAIYKAAEK